MVIYKNVNTITEILDIAHGRVLFLFKTQRVGDWILSPSSGKSIFSWAQSIELVPISGHQHKTEYINQTQSRLVLMLVSGDRD
jgi:hypothetical protein